MRNDEKGNVNSDRGGVIRLTQVGMAEDAKGDERQQSLLWSWDHQPSLGVCDWKKKVGKKGGRK